MKTLQRLFVALITVFLLSGCGAIAVHADNTMGGHLQKWMYGVDNSDSSSTGITRMKHGDGILACDMKTCWDESLAKTN